MKPKPHYQSGDKIGGRYQVHQALMGGMGEVYLCLDLEENYPYALKTFQQRHLTTGTQRLHQAFEKEVATWVALEKHPNIVRCFHMDTLDNQPFMILEWIAGEEGKGTDLRGWLWRGPLALQLALDFTIDVCRGLIHAQEKQPGLIHRDLNPRNILVAQGRLAKITDFGLAEIIRQTDLELDAVGVESDGRKCMVNQKGIAGTPPYMAPEQWRGESLDERTDIYALGCLLYEMLTGAPPFQVDFRPVTRSETERWLRAMQAQHENSPIPALPASLPAAPGDLLHSCLAKRREERFDKVQDLLQELELIYRQQFGEPPKDVPTSGRFTIIDYVNRGNTYGQLQCYDKSLADLDRAIQLAPTLAPAYSARGNTYDAMQCYEEALADYTQAIQNDSIYAPAYNNRGKTYNTLEHYDQALADLDCAINLDPTYTKAYVNRGNVFHVLDRYEEALTDYDKAIQLDSFCAPAYSNRGLVFHKLQHYEKALADYSRVIKLDPIGAASYSNRGDTYVKLRRYDKALADYDRAIELDPNYAQVYNNRGVIYCGYQSYGKALEDFTKAIQIDPAYAQAYYNRGNAYDEMQYYDKALADYTQAINLDPAYAQAYSDRGIVYYNLQCYQEALTDYNRAIQIDPTLAMAYSNRGLVYARLQCHEEALAEHLRAIQVDPTYALAYLNAGILLYNLGELREALPYFKGAAQHGDPRGLEYAIEVRRELGI